MLKITQHDTNNNYYVRMYIDKKRLPHIGMEVPCILSPIHTIYYRIRNIIFYCILLSKAAFKSPTASGI